MTDKTNITVTIDNGDYKIGAHGFLYKWSPVFNEWFRTECVTIEEVKTAIVFKLKATKKHRSLSDD